MTTDIQGPTRAAAVLLSLDRDTAAEVLKRLGHDEIRRLASLAGALRPTPATAIEATLGEFVTLMNDELQVALRRPTDHIHGIARHALGSEAASRILEEKRAVGPVERLEKARPDALASLLEEEHPQVASAVLLQLSPDRAAQVLAALPDEARIDILRRIGSTDRVPKSIVAQVSEALAAALMDADAEETKDAGVDGVAFAAAMLNALKGDDKNKLLEGIEGENAEFAQKIREKMFTFEDLLKVVPAGLQVLMREIPSDKMLIALKTASADLRERLLSVLSKRARESLLEDLALLPPTRVSDVEAAQKEITDIALRLADEGRLVLPFGSEEKLV
jgi:flagellar motor switch protein FliG